MEAFPTEAEAYDRRTEVERRFGPRQPVDPYPNIRVFDGVTRAIIGDRIYEYNEGCVGLCVGLMQPFFFPQAPAPAQPPWTEPTPRWPSPRAKNFAMRLKLPKPTGRWSHDSALDALALHAHMDRATLLATHPIDYLARIGRIMDIKLLPREEIAAYKGPVWGAHPWLCAWSLRL